MKCEWFEIPLGEIIKLVIDYRGKTPKKLGGDWSQSGYRALSAKNIKTGRIVQPNTIRFVNEEMYKKWMKDEIERGDILITSEAPFGQIYYWDSDEKIVLSQRLFGVRIKNEYCSKYIYYYMTTPNFQGELESRATGTTVVGLRQPELMKCIVHCPPLEEQKRIAAILSALDDKIELNRKINENLEQQAQTIFCSMFLTKDATTPATIADVSLNVTDGVHNTVHDDSKGEYLLLSCKNIKGGHLTIGSSERTISKEIFEKLRKRTNLAKGDVLISSVGTIGELLLLNTEPYNYEFQRSVAIVKPNPMLVSSFYIYEALIAQRAELINAAHGAVQQCLFIADIAGFPIGIPRPNDLAIFNSIVAPMFDTISSNEEEIASLSSIRDTLLPKVMSGEIDVSAVQI